MKSCVVTDEALSKKQGNESVLLASLHATLVSSYLSQVFKSTHSAPFDVHFFNAELYSECVFVILMVI